MKPRIHTTAGGDRFLRTHISDSTPWSRRAYRPPSRELPADRVTRCLLTIAAVLGVIGLGAIIIFVIR